VNLEQAASTLSNSLSRILDFRRDDRFLVVLGEFKIEEKHKARAILETYLPEIWDEENLHSAPQSIDNITSAFGGINAGQELLTATFPGEGILFCAWWPWRNGQVVSLRIGVINRNAEETLTDAGLSDVMAWFGVA